MKGRWSKEEHDNFLTGMGIYGKNWDVIMELFVPTRTATQIRTHAQKYFKKMEMGLPFPEEVRYHTSRLSGTTYSSFEHKRDVLFFQAAKTKYRPEWNYCYCTQYHLFRQSSFQEIFCLIIPSRAVIEKRYGNILYSTTNYSMRSRQTTAGTAVEYVEIAVLFLNMRFMLCMTNCY